MTYEVRYKSIRANEWSKIPNVVEDGIIPDTATRFFLDFGKRRYEIPTENMLFEFSSERQKIIEANAAKNANPK